MLVELLPSSFMSVAVLLMQKLRPWWLMGIIHCCDDCISMEHNVTGVSRVAQTVMIHGFFLIFCMPGEKWNLDFANFEALQCQCDDFAFVAWNITSTSHVTDASVIAEITIMSLMLLKSSTWSFIHETFFMPPEHEFTCIWFKVLCHCHDCAFIAWNNSCHCLWLMLVELLSSSFMIFASLIVSQKGWCDMVWCHSVFCVLVAADSCSVLSFSFCWVTPSSNNRLSVMWWHADQSCLQCTFGSCVIVDSHCSSLLWLMSCGLGGFVTHFCVEHHSSIIVFFVKNLFLISMLFVFHWIKCLYCHYSLAAFFQEATCCWWCQLCVFAPCECRSQSIICDDCVMLLISAVSLLLLQLQLLRVLFFMSFLVFACWESENWEFADFKPLCQCHDCASLHGTLCHWCVQCTRELLKLSSFMNFFHTCFSAMSSEREKKLQNFAHFMHCRNLMIVPCFFAHVTSCHVVEQTIVAENKQSWLSWLLSHIDSLKIVSLFILWMIPAWAMSLCLSPWCKVKIWTELTKTEDFT